MRLCDGEYEVEMSVRGEDVQIVLRGRGFSGVTWEPLRHFQFIPKAASESVAVKMAMGKKIDKARLALAIESEWRNLAR